MALLTPYWGLDGILLLLSATVALYLYMTRHFRYWKKRNIMEIPPMPFLGNFTDCLLLRKTPGEFVKELYDMGKGLPYVGFYIFDKPFFLVRDPEVVKQVLVKDFSSFADRYASTDVKDRLGYTNLFLIKNPAWKTLRSKLTPIFTSGKLKKMFDLMIEIGRDLDTHLEKLALDGTGRVIEVKDLSGKFTTDLIGTTAYGLRANSLQDSEAPFRKYGKMVFDYNFYRAVEFLIIFFRPSLVSLLGVKFFGKQSTKFIRSAFWEAITQRMASGQKRNDLIDVLIDLKKNHENEDLGGFKFDGDDLVAQAAVFFTGGFETSSTTMSFALYELALHPDIQNRLRKEIHDALEETDGKVTYDMVMSLPYLDMVVSETLRRYPPLPFLDRCAGENYKLPNSDVILEKGTPVFISMIGLHYDPQYFPDPEKFDPERFNEENKKKIPSFTYFPFGEGPHVCIGSRLGLLQTKLGLMHVLKKHEVLPCEKTLIPMRLDPKAVTTTALGGLYLTIRKVTTNDN